MNSIKLLQSRAVIATMLLFSFLALEDHGQVRADDVDVTAQVSDSTPGPFCADSTWDISFQPTVTEDISIDLDPDLALLEDSTSIDLGLVNGQDENCAFITGTVGFSESGFEDAQDTPAGFLSTTFSCDGTVAADAGGLFSCGDGTTSPTSIDVDVTADLNSGATVGTYVNTISIELYANP